MTERVVGLVTARGGSKGIPHKNLIFLANKPLIAHTINAAIAALGKDFVWVSSDCQQILSTGLSYGAQSIERPAILATDEATSDEVVLHAIKQLQLRDDDIIALLQPTSPLRTSVHLIEALELMKTYHHPVVSVKRLAGKYHHLMVLEDKKLSWAIRPELIKSRRQDAADFCEPNGAIYLFAVADFYKNNNNIPRAGATPYIMDEQSSIDIDTMNDLNLAENALIASEGLCIW